MMPEAGTGDLIALCASKNIPLNSAATAVERLVLSVVDGAMPKRKLDKCTFCRVVAADTAGSCPATTRVKTQISGLCRYSRARDRPAGPFIVRRGARAMGETLPRTMFELLTKTEKSSLAAAQNGAEHG
ncbi:hypothetical protein GCM10008020_16240 [Massilia psychrophila]|nr:hypothetical protein GCM10008020_16240 [Massilia psychrophila]